MKMDYAKILISSVLVIVYIILFGRESIEKLMQREKSISHTENEPKIIKAPGYTYDLKIVVRMSIIYNN